MVVLDAGRRGGGWRGRDHLRGDAAAQRAGHPGADGALSMARRHLIVCGLACAAAALGACSNDDPGVVVSVDLAGFDVKMLRVAIGASDGGFKMQKDTSVENVGVSTPGLERERGAGAVSEVLS